MRGRLAKNAQRLRPADVKPDASTSNIPSNFILESGLAQSLPMGKGRAGDVAWSWVQRGRMASLARGKGNGGLGCPLYSKQARRHSNTGSHYLVRVLKMTRDFRALQKAQVYLRNGTATSETRIPIWYLEPLTTPENARKV